MMRSMVLPPMMWEKFVIVVQKPFNFVQFGEIEPESEGRFDAFFFVYLFTVCIRMNDQDGNGEKAEWPEHVA